MVKKNAGSYLGIASRSLLIRSAIGTKKRNRVIIGLEKNRYEKHLINRSYYHCNCNDLYECNIKNISSRAYRTWIHYYSNLIL